MICVFGLSHISAPLPLRERYHFGDEEAVALLRELTARSVAEEGVFLSTCNRSELYLSAEQVQADGLRAEVLGRIGARKGSAEGDLDRFFFYHGSHAVGHLFRVAAGLDSMIVGENQILGQLKDAYRLSATRGMTGRVLDRLFHKAFETGKRVRTETGLNKGASSVSSTAVELAAELVGELDEKRVLLLGAGETGALVLESLADRGCSRLHVANRTRSTAEATARLRGAEVRSFRDARSQLHDYDIVVVSTSADEPVLRAAHIEELTGRDEEPLLIMDLSVPRNVELPGSLPPGVTVYNVDDLQAMAERSRDRRAGEVRGAEEIVYSQRDEFLAWLSSLQLSPTIHKLKEKTQSLYEKDLAALRKKLEEDEYGRLEEFSRYLEGRWLGLVIKNLRRLTENGRNLGYIEMVHRLFGLDDPGDGNGAE